MWLRLNGLSIALGQKTIIQDLSLTLAEGDIACLLGPSGCGKTTALRSIAGFESLSGGSITLGGQLLADAQQQVPAHQRAVGMVFQDYALFPHLSVAANIGFGLHAWPRADRARRIDELLVLVGLQGYAQAYPHQLSGGQQQRVSLARALAPKPKLLLLDEPFSNLDADLRQSLAQEVRQVLKQEGITAILVTHDQQEAFAFADQIGLIDQGRLQQWGSPMALYQQPVNKTVAQFLGQGSWLTAAVVDAHQLRFGLGDYVSPEPHGLAIGTEVTVLIRPHELCCCQGEGLGVEVLASVFQGGSVRHTLRLGNGEVTYADWPVPHTGTVGVRLQLDQLIAFAA